MVLQTGYNLAVWISYLSKQAYQLPQPRFICKHSLVKKSQAQSPHAGPYDAQGTGHQDYG